MTEYAGKIPIAETSLTDYFCKQLNIHAEHLQSPPHADTRWHIGNLLDRLGRSDQLFTYQEGQMTLRPLVLLYSDAVEANNERQRCLLLQNLGDMALFLGALFPERWARKGIGKDYFVGMGGGAYDYLADNARANNHIFAELANTFTRMLELVARTCSKKQQMSAREILALYQRWLQSHDPMIEAQLRALGIELQGSERLQ